MAVKLSRRKIAEYVADKVREGQSINHVIDEVAAYLVDNRQTRSAELVARATEDALMSRDIVVASVASARPLTEAQKDFIRALFDGKKVYMDETVEPDLIGGIKVEAPGMRLDSTIKRKLHALSRAKI